MALGEHEIPILYLEDSSTIWNTKYLPWKIEDNVLIMYYSIGYDEYEG